MGVAAIVVVVVVVVGGGGRGFGGVVVVGVDVGVVVVVGVVDDCCRCDRGSGLRSYQRELLLWKIKERSEENNFDDHGNIIYCQ